MLWGPDCYHGDKAQTTRNKLGVTQPIKNRLRVYRAEGFADGSWGDFYGESSYSALH